MTTRWRGTLVYIGSAAVIAVAVVAKVQSSQAEEPTHLSHGARHDTGTHTGETGGTSHSPSHSASAPEASTPEASPPPTSGVSATPSPSPSPIEPTEVTITGDVIETREGHVQVAVSFQGESIVEIVALQAGHGGKAADEFNAKVLPVLREAALDAQSAQFDTITGATYTSEGYKASLQSAIDQLP